ncbi:U32 family peptidase [Leptolyngbya sp. FACHB-261]|uniref:U32 family peptidase n=1 Tax=Leptolyngbya sp. FACHB-261 TaxID=2692806 RepID=UPI0016866BAA|nr:U32 family peptidase [Leptolyngbya sp. FACHB-261]MBD2099732.1 U32 family peptidase [Leptolyngbya sp. FACHB-261]
MQFNTFIASIHDLERCANAPDLAEVLLEPRLLARQGKLSDGEVHSLASEALKQGLRPVLVCDVLMTERSMTRVCEQLTHWDLNCFGAIRVSDPGVAYWLQTHFPDLPLQFIAETGNHNLEALQGWCDILASSLERLILSIELPEEKLVEYCQALPVACELLGVGQILLFYSPRPLLSEPSISDGQEELYLETTAAFEEARDRHFPLLQTEHGTFMFLDKDQFILDKLERLQAAGLHTVRLDLRHLSQAGDIAVGVDQICHQIREDPVALRTNWPRPTRAPFFKANRTTALFPRMRSTLLEHRNAACLAEVLAGEGGKYVVFHSLRPFETSLAKSILLPTGEEIAIPQNLAFRDLSGEVADNFESEQILITDWIKKVTPGSLLLGQ